MKIELYEDGIGAVEYIQHMGDDLTVVNSARVSFGQRKSEMDDRDRKLVRYLMEHRHTSTLEHNVVTCLFTVPLFVRSQHHRHRTWSFNEISRRYTAENLQFYLPGELRQQSKSNRQASTDDIIEDGLLNGLVLQHHEAALALYRRLLDRGVCREQARGVLPQNLYTHYWGTVDLHNALRFCELRLHDGAQWETRQVAQALLEIMSTLWPHAITQWKELRDEH
jgi:thymidylate synthase (FAD)